MNVEATPQLSLSDENGHTPVIGKEPILSATGLVGPINDLDADTDDLPSPPSECVTSSTGMFLCYVLCFI